MQKVCRCAAYALPHELDEGKCRDLYNEQANECVEWHEGWANRETGIEQETNDEVH